MNEDEIERLFKRHYGMLSKRAQMDLLTELLAIYLGEENNNG